MEGRSSAGSSGASSVVDSTPADNGGDEGTGTGGVVSVAGSSELADAADGLCETFVAPIASTFGKNVEFISPIPTKKSSIGRL